MLKERLWKNIRAGSESMSKKTFELRRLNKMKKINVCDDSGAKVFKKDKWVKLSEIGGYLINRNPWYVVTEGKKQVKERRKEELMPDLIIEYDYDLILYNPKTKELAMTLKKFCKKIKCRGCGVRK
jgi:hypothetical protein